MTAVLVGAAAAVEMSARFVFSVAMRSHNHSHQSY
jgi:hypothetical protein